MRSFCSPRFKKAFAAAFTCSLPICAAFCSIGFSYGFLMHSLGFSWIYPAAMSFLIYAGSMEFVTINLLLAPFSPLHAFLLGLMVNARHLFYGISMLERYGSCGWKKYYLIFGMCDETFSINSGVKLPEDIDRPLFMTLVTALNHCYWVSGAVAGALLGTVINFKAEGIEFMMTALFTAILLMQWDSTKEHRPAILGLGLSFICLLLFGPENFVLPAMGAVLGAMLLLQSKLDPVKQAQRAVVQTANARPQSAPVLKEGR